MSAGLQLAHPSAPRWPSLTGSALGALDGLFLWAQGERAPGRVGPLAVQPRSCAASQARSSSRRGFFKLASAGLLHLSPRKKLISGSTSSLRLRLRLRPAERAPQPWGPLRQHLLQGGGYSFAQIVASLPENRGPLLSGREPQLGRKMSTSLQRAGGLLLVLQEEEKGILGQLGSAEPDNRGFLQAARLLILWTSSH